MKQERAQVICPACGQRVDAVATDGRVKGYCAAAKQHVDFLIETRRVVETKAGISAAGMLIKQSRDSKGRFVKGNVPWNRKGKLLVL